jgi:CelD/BcsL family acetyltransferase involved in cellulose biosynthesis
VLARLVPLGETGALESAWRELAVRALEPNVFAEPALLQPGAARMSHDDVFLLVVEDAGRLTLALPVVRRPAYRRVPVPALTTWRHPHLALGTPLVDPGDPVGAWACALEEISRRAPWAALEELPLEGPVFAAFGRAAAAGRHRWSVHQPWERPMVVRRADGAYLDGRLGKRRRKTLRRQQQRLAETVGPVRVHDLALDGDWTAALEEFVAVERRGWKGRAGTAIGCSPEQLAWFRDSASALHRDARLQIFALCAGEHRLAYLVTAVSRGTVFHLKIAYDEDYAWASPGLQLEIEMVAQFHHDESLQSIDACTGREATVSDLLYPDRRRMGTVLVSGTTTGGLLVRSLPVVAAGLDRATAEWRRRKAGP